MQTDAADRCPSVSHSGLTLNNGNLSKQSAIPNRTAACKELKQKIMIFTNRWRCLMANLVQERSLDVESPILHAEGLNLRYNIVELETRVRSNLEDLNANSVCT